MRIPSSIRYGKLVEPQKDEFFTDVAPSIAAAQTWLYNRCPDKWKRDPQKGLLDEIDDDTSIKIEVTRVGYGNEDDSDWQQEVNSEVKVRKATEAEKLQAEKEKEEKRKQGEAEDEADELDENEWPDNWEELIGDD